MRQAGNRWSSLAAALTPWRELTLVGVLAFALSALLYGSYVTDGGRYLDDWWISAALKFPTAHGFSDSWEAIRYYAGWRPLACLYWLLTLDVLAAHESVVRVMTLVLVALVAMAFHWLLRELGLRAVPAATIAGLTVLAPTASSVRLWLTPSVSQLCLLLFLLGALASLRAFRASGRRAVALHCAGIALYASSLAIAELTVGFVTLAGLMYALRIPWRRVVRRAVADLSLALGAVAHYLASSPTRRATEEGTSTVEHVFIIARDTLTLTTSYLFPPIRSQAIIALSVLAVVATAIFVARRHPKGHPGGEAALRWLVVCAAGTVALAAAYAPYATSVYDPLDVGIGNRVNAAAVLPFCVVVVGLISLFASLFPRGTRAWLFVRAATVVGLVAMVATAFAQRFESDKRLWTEAAKIQRASLQEIHRLLPMPPSDSALFVFGVPGAGLATQRVGFSDAAVPVPVFFTWWEMRSAVRLSYGRSDVDAFQVWAEQRPQIACGRRTIYHFGLDGVRHAVPYGRAYFVDLRGDSAHRVIRERQCARLVEEIRSSVFAVSI